MSEIKNILHRIYRLNLQKKGGVTLKKEIATETIHNETQRGKKKDYNINEHNTSELWNNLKQPTECVIGVWKERRDRGGM